MVCDPLPSVQENFVEEYILAVAKGLLWSFDEEFNPSLARFWGESPTPESVRESMKETVKFRRVYHDEADAIAAEEDEDDEDGLWDDD